MYVDERRITLVTRPTAPQSERTWNCTSDSSSRIIVAGSFKVLRYALENSMSGLARDVERLVVDRAATPEQYLELLASLPEGFGGDVLFIRDDGSAFLSATGRGSGRMIYDLSADDLRFYLTTHGLLAQELLRLTA